MDEMLFAQLPCVVMEAKLELEAAKMMHRGVAKSQGR